MLGRRYGSVVVLGPMVREGALVVASMEDAGRRATPGSRPRLFRNDRRLLGFLFSMDVSFPGTPCSAARVRASWPRGESRVTVLRRLRC
jgi:hypothetical protein